MDPFEGYGTVSQDSNFPYSMNGNFYLAEDIIITEPITDKCTLNGIFDGNGHTITFDIQNLGNGCYPLFTEISDGSVVKNLTLKGKLCFNAELTNVAPFGTNDGYIINCSIADLEMSSKSSNPINKYLMCTDGEGYVVGCIIDGNTEAENVTYSGCFKKGDTPTDETIQNLNNEISSYNNTVDEIYKCNYHFKFDDETLVLVKD